MKVTIGKHKVEVRGLTRGEIKQLRKDGYPLETAAELEDLVKRDDALDKLFELASPGFDADQLTQAEAVELWTAIVEMTYVGELISGKLKEGPQSSSSQKGSTAKSAKTPASKSKGTAQK